MRDYETFPYENYTYDTPYIRIPSISVDLQRDTAEAIQAAVDAYLSADGQSGEAVDYRRAFLASLSDNTHVYTMFQRDICAAVGLATIDLATNTYTANEKADDIFTEACRGVSLSNRTGLQTAGENVKRIYDNIFTKDDQSGVVYNTMLAAVTYDEKAIETVLDIGGSATPVIFYLDRPGATDVSREFTAYAQESDQWVARYTLSYEDELWRVKEGTTTLFTTDDIDAASITWTAAEESSSSGSASVSQASEESSSSAAQESSSSGEAEESSSSASGSSSSGE